MCHFLLLLPVLALPAFWIWPLETALPVYASAVAVALAVYALAYKGSCRSRTGRKRLSVQPDA